MIETWDVRPRRVTTWAQSTRTVQVLVNVTDAGMGVAFCRVNLNDAGTLQQYQFFSFPDSPKSVLINFTWWLPTAHVVYDLEFQCRDAHLQWATVRGDSVIEVSDFVPDPRVDGCDPQVAYAASETATECSMKTAVCPTDWYVVNPLSSTSDRMCEPCPSNYGTRGRVNHTLPRCLPNFCGEGTWFRKIPLRFFICPACPPGTFQSLPMHNETECRPHRNCSALGLSEVIAPNRTFDRVCNDSDAEENENVGPASAAGGSSSAGPAVGAVVVVVLAIVVLGVVLHRRHRARNRVQELVYSADNTVPLSVNQLYKPKHKNASQEEEEEGGEGEVAGGEPVVYAAGWLFMRILSLAFYLSSLFSLFISFFFFSSFCSSSVLLFFVCLVWVGVID